MTKRSSTYLILLFLVTLSHVKAFDPISIGIGLGAGGFHFMKENVYCRYTECCNNDYIPANITALDQKIKSSLYGQHIVVNTLTAALIAHVDAKQKPKKPLVISFHGTAGTGKNFVADMVAEALYKNGLKSQYVHKYMGMADFPVTAKSEEYRERVVKDVRDGIANCPRSLFIFDELSQMPKGVFDALTTLLGHHSALGHLDYTQAIFLFLSNSAGVQISDHLGELMKSYTLRENTKLRDFENIVKEVAYNTGGLKYSALIDSYVIDHYIPFLPLEKSHIIKCVQAEYLRRNRFATEPNISDVLNDITYDPTHNIFAESGCKGIEKKVAVQTMRM